MAYLFVVLFLLAVVGIFRPFSFLPDIKRWQYGLGAFVCFVMVGVFAPDTSNSNATESADTLAAATSTSSTNSAGPTEKPSTWRYNNERDAMRDSERRFAETESENVVDLDFPYGEQKGFLTVRQDPEFGLDVMFSVRSGQILCSSFGASHLNAKFDDGPIRRFRCTDASDGSSEVAFITDSRSFLKALKEAERTVIEAEFYQNGRVQYVFDTSGLEWE